MITFKIDAATVKALLLVAGKGDIRYYINGVLLDMTGSAPALVATDGHRLLAVRLTRHDGEIDDMPAGKVAELGDVAPGNQYIIPRELLESVAPRKNGKYFLPLTVSISGEAVCIEGATTATGKLVDGRYPDWRKVMPDTRSADPRPAQFNAEYVADFGKVAKLLTGDKSRQPRFRHCGPHNSALVTFTDGAVDAVGILMPMRLDVESAVPAWVTNEAHGAESMAA